MTAPADFATPFSEATIAPVDDVSESQRVTRELGEALELNRRILGASAMGCIAYLAEGPCVFANEAAGRIIGASHAQVVAQNFREIGSWRSSGLYDAALSVLESGVDQSGATHFTSTFGQEVWMDYHLTRATSAGRALLLLFIRNTTAEHRALMALRASEERLGLALSAVNDAVWDWDIPSGTTFTSPQAAALLGYEEGAVLPPWPEWPARLVQEDRSPLEAVVREYAAGTREVHHLEVRVGTGRWLLTRGRLVARGEGGQPLRVVGTLTDIDARKRAEEEQRALAERVRHTQRLESLGVLAGGVAHDFNNIMTVVLNALAVARLQGKPGAELEPHLETAERATAQATSLCRQLLAYAGQARLVVQPLELAALVERMEAILAASVSKKVALTLELTRGSSTIIGDETQIRQIVLNLVINASEAITGSEGKIRVSTGECDCDAATLARSVAGGAVVPGRFVWVQVEDNGVGMSEETVARMFDPFFSTKFTGRGLGMASVLGIVRGHGGAIEVDSMLGRGTRIRALFPLREGELAAPDVDEPERFTGHGVILVVDDERNVRTATEMLLSSLGFEVLLAANGEEALSVYRTHAARISLVLMDLTMPRMNGAEALRALREIDPEVRAIVTSGYGAGHLDEQLSEAKPYEVLQKPYSVQALIAVLRRVLGTT